MYAMPTSSTFITMNATMKVSQTGWSAMRRFAPRPAPAVAGRPSVHATKGNMFPAIELPFDRFERSPLNRIARQTGSRPECRAYGTAKLSFGRPCTRTDAQDSPRSAALPVYRPEYDVDRPNQRHHVRQHRALRHMRQH